MSDPAPPIRLSLIMHTYERAGVLEQSLPPLLELIEPYDDVELILSDNASTDGSGDVIERLGTGRPRVTVIRQPQNLGFEQHAMAAFAPARGTYVWFVGDDDLIYPEAFTSLMQHLPQRDEELFFLPVDGIGECEQAHKFMLEPGADFNFREWPTQDPATGWVLGSACFRLAVVSRADVLRSQLDNWQKYAETAYAHWWITLRTQARRPTCVVANTPIGHGNKFIRPQKRHWSSKQLVANRLRIAESLIGEADLSMLDPCLADLVQRWLGGSARRKRDLLKHTTRKLWLRSIAPRTMRRLQV